MTDKIVVIKELSIEATEYGGIIDGTGFGIRDLPIGPLQPRTSED